MFKKIRVSSLAGAIISAILLTLSFPKPGLYPLAWIALVPLMYASMEENGKNAFIIGYICGLCHFLTLLYWVVPTLNTYGYINIVLCIPILFLLCAYLAIYFGIFAFSMTHLRGSCLPFLLGTPATWVSLEYIRTKALSGFPWELVGYSQHNFSEIIQIADITGVYGISAIIILCNAALCLIFKHYKSKNSSTAGKSIIKSTVFTALIVLSAFLYGQMRITDYQKKSPGSIVATVIQGNIDQDQKWDSRFQTSSTLKYIRLSEAAVSKSPANKPDFIIWPETATPFYYLHNKRLTRLVKNGIMKTGSHYIIGTPSFIKENENFTLFNSARLISPKGDPEGKYDKVHLVPFGEYVPLNEFIPFIDTLTAQSGNFSPGESGLTLNTEKAKAGVQICFEIIFPELSAKMVQNGADLLVNITNDAWFGTGSAPYQHFSMVKFRAIETRRSLARAANTGISGFISPWGSTLSASNLFEETSMTEKLPIFDDITFYTKHGDLFVLLCFITAAMLFFFEYNGKRVLKKNN